MRSLDTEELAIMERLSDGREHDAGTLPLARLSLRTRGLVSERFDEGSEILHPRWLYRITGKGRRVLEQEREALRSEEGA